MKSFSIFCLLLVSAVRADVSHLVNGCRIFTMDGIPVKTFPGDICLFFPDGSFVSASVSKLTKFSLSDQVQWEIERNFHHQLELDHQQETILAIGNVVKEKIRYDTFAVINLSGKILHEVTSDSYFTERKMKPKVLPTSEFIRTRSGADSEAGHFNSFYQIPKLVSAVKHPDYLKTGNFIVNALSDGVFIISPDLQKVLHHFRISQSHDHQVHDVQVSPSGSYLYFNNRGSEGGPVNRYSAIQLMNPEGKLLFSYTSEPKEFFYSNACGGVQELDTDRILFSDVLNATYVYSRKARKLERAVTGTHRNREMPWNSLTQRVKAYDLKKFLSVRN